MLVPIPCCHGKTWATQRTSHCTANSDFCTCALAMVGCYIHWCYCKSDKTTKIQSATCLLLLSLGSSGGSLSELLQSSSIRSSFFRFFGNTTGSFFFFFRFVGSITPTLKIMRKHVVCSANNLPGDTRLSHASLDSNQRRTLLGSWFVGCHSCSVKTNFSQLWNTACRSVSVQLS